MKSKFRRWIDVLFGKNKKIEEIVQSQVGEEHYKRVEMWKALYSGYCKDIHDVKFHTIEKGTKTRKLHSLKMPKVISQELAKLIFTEKVNINIDNEKYSDNIHKALNDSRFYKVFQSKVENMFALGGLVLKAQPKEKEDGTFKLSISYVTPDCFIPISWEDDIITEGVFVKITRKENKIYYLFEFHKWEVVSVIEEGSNEKEAKKIYVITNELYVSDKETEMDMKAVELSDIHPDLEPVTKIEDLTQPLFQYIKPNIANNFDLQSPLGISIYANSIDTLKAIDIAFDSLIREFRLGKRRIIVPSSAVRTIVDPSTGEFQRYFDANDESYEGFNFQDAEKQKITDNTVALRVDEHVAGINALLNLLAMQTGLSAGTFTFDGQGVKTATEVVSENSKTYQTKQINEEILEEGLSKFIRTIGEVASLYEIFDEPDEYEIEFNWDDTIIKDKYKDSDFWIKLKNAGLVDAAKCLEEILGYTEEQALEMTGKVLKERQTMNPDVEDFIGGAE